MHSSIRKDFPLSSLGVLCAFLPYRCKSGLLNMSRNKEVQMSDNKKHRKNGEGTLFKRKDGRWQASFVPEHGKRLYFYGKTQAEALEKLRKAQHEEKKGVLSTGPKQRLGDYLTQWLEDVYKPTVRLSSYMNYKAVIHTHLVPELGHLFIQKLT